MLLIEPDDFTRILLAKEVERTMNSVISLDDYKTALSVIQNNEVSLIICDDDFSESAEFLETLLSNDLKVPFITLSTFLSEPCCDHECLLCGVKKPLDNEGYARIRKEIGVL